MEKTMHNIGFSTGQAGKVNIEPEEENQEDERKELADKEFAAEVRRLRNKAGLSQRALGSLIGVEQTIITRIEKGDHGVTLDLVLRLAAAFHDDPHRLADVYWGTGTGQFVNDNKRILDEIWDLIYPFYQPKVKTTPITLRQPTSLASPHDATGIEAQIQEIRQDAKDKENTENMEPENSKSEGEEKDN